MSREFYFTLFTFFIIFQVSTQELPYKQIPEAPEQYNSGNIVARMVDGLGYRYYWATEGLTERDLAYRPTEESRNVLETLQHIYGMSDIILNVPEAKPNVRPKDFSRFSFKELRKMTLTNLKAASDKYRSSPADSMHKFAVIFQRGQRQIDFPFWNMLNGMLSDCIYHTGQVVAFRRISGNPMNPKVNVFLGKNRD